LHKWSSPLFVVITIYTKLFTFSSVLSLGLPGVFSYLFWSNEDWRGTVPVTTMGLPKDYLYYLNDSRAKVLITSSELAPQFTQIQNELKFLRHFIVF